MQRQLLCDRPDIGRQSKRIRAGRCCGFLVGATCGENEHKNTGQD
jgi:hypothetical protein